MHEPDFTPTEEAFQVRAWRPGHPDFEVHVYPYGQEPLLWIYAQGAWRSATVRARHQYSFGTAYQVDIRLPDPPYGHQTHSRTYRWGTDALQVRPRQLTPEQVQDWIDLFTDDDPSPGRGTALDRVGPGTGSTEYTTPPTNRPRPHCAGIDGTDLHPGR